LRFRLSLLMFLQYAVPGAWVPLFSLRLTELAFTQVEIGWAGATYALAALATPFLAGQLADRWFAAERCLACFSLTAGCLLWLLAGLTEPAAVSATALVFFLTGFTEGEESTPAACPEPADSLVPAQRMT
jgi:NHS family xanthosine MFS transporter